MTVRACFVLLASILFLPSAAHAQANIAQIISPIDGATYPRNGPTPGDAAAVVPFSLATRCFDQDYSVAWGVNNDQLGEAHFIDQGTIQFTHKLPEGSHQAWLKTDCDGYDQAEFVVE